MELETGLGESKEEPQMLQGAQGPSVRLYRALLSFDGRGILAQPTAGVSSQGPLPTPKTCEEHVKQEPVYCSPNMPVGQFLCKKVIIIETEGSHSPGRDHKKGLGCVGW